MRKYQDLAAPDDPNSWHDVDAFWPTNRGTYETADFLSGTTYTATSCANPTYAWIARCPLSRDYVEHIVDGSRIFTFYAYSPAGLECIDTTNGVSVGRPQFAQYGIVTIGVMGSPQREADTAISGYATVKCIAPGGVFTALAGAPQGESIVVQSNAVGIFNTDTSPDGFAFSDVGDYTNWSTGESVSGRLYQTPGPIRAAVAFHDAVYAFKDYSIYRLRYVGGLVKWAVELVWVGVGASSGTASSNHNRACAGATGILFAGPLTSDSGTPSTPYYWFDGVNPPVLTNPYTTVGNGSLVNGPIIYNPVKDLFSVWQSGAVWYYSPSLNAWGKNSTPGAGSSAIPVEGDYAGRTLAATRSSTTECWTKSATNTLKRWLGSQTTGSCYLQTKKLGKPDRKTLWTRCTPLLRRRADLGTDSAALSVTTYREREDTSAQTTTAVTESTARKRFDFTVADNFAQFKVTWTDLDVEVDDFLIASKDAGAE